MAYEVVMSYHLHMPSYFLGTFTEYPCIESLTTIHSNSRQHSPHNILNTNLDFILFCSSFQVIVNGLARCTNLP